MRYKLSLPKLRGRARSPSRQTSNPLSIQRAQPTECVVSLASVTVSMISTDSDMDQTDMSVNHVIADKPLAPTGTQTAAIPFPTSCKRTHSLLRSTSCNHPQSSENISYDSEHEASRSISDGDCDPPRKRTRTSALSSSPRLLVRRCISTPTTAPPSLGLQYADGTSSGLADASCTTTLTAPTAPIISVASKAPASALPRRKWRTGNLRVQIFVYRALVYGLKVKYSDCDREFVDFADGMLAQHLRTELKEMGAPLDILVVNPQTVSRETEAGPLPDFNPLRMVVEDADNGTQEADDLPALPLHLQPSTIYSVRSYQQLVAVLFFSKEFRFMRPRHPLSKVGAWKAQMISRRQSSKLAQCIFLES